jgi:ubiquinone/menaquinone biosynthesis C-methylase UbiE
MRTASFLEYSKKRRECWKSVAQHMHRQASWGRYYHHKIGQIYGYLIQPGLRVLEIGCARGDLLASLAPSVGVGIDFSEQMVTTAVSRYPELLFAVGDAHYLPVHTKFDVVILSDLANDLYDVQAVFDEIYRVVNAETRIIINHYSKFWEIPLLLTQLCGLSTRKLHQNWLTREDIKGLLALSSFESVHTWSEILFPLEIPLLTNLLNRYAVKIWPFRYASLTSFIIARKNAPRAATVEAPSVSVIVPSRNEAGNIRDIIARTPEMGRHTQLLFVEGHSTDNTWEVIQTEIERNSERDCRGVQQSGRGKGDAVRQGFSSATGDILMILDADMTVPPEILPRFYDALVSGKGQFINGVRLVYPMEKQAMRFLNLLGNKFFSLVFSWLLGQPIKDTLCGTKVLWKNDYHKISANRSYFGDFDPFGDFDLLFGAARLHLKIVEVPIRYQSRQYGETNIDRWRHGWMLLKMAFFAARKIKFF